MSDCAWSVVAAEVSRLQVDRSVVTDGGSHEVIDVPILMWVLRDGTSTVVVDTGTHPAGSDGAAAHPRPMTQSPEGTPLGVLDRLGIDPAEVTHVVNTHLHWDHCSNNDLFPEASVYIQERDIIASLDPPPGQELSFESARAGMRPPWLKAVGRTVPVRGDHVLLPGIELLLVPGHTPGSQAVVVDTDRGRVLLAGDLVPVNDNLGDDTTCLPGIVNSREEAARSLRRVRELGIPVLAAHDVPPGAREIAPGIWHVAGDLPTKEQTP